MRGTAATNAALQGAVQAAGDSAPLRKRFGGFFDNVNDVSDVRASVMSVATYETAVTATESAVTADTPQPSGSTNSSPRIRCGC